MSQISLTGMIGPYGEKSQNLTKLPTRRDKKIKGIKINLSVIKKRGITDYLPQDAKIGRLC